MENEKKFISLLSDYGFKVAFADESNTLFLRRALQALIQSEIPIKKVQFLRNEFVGITEDSRGGVFDLVCEDEKQRTFIVEMQLGYYKHFIQRAKFYAFQRFNTLVEKGKYQFDNLTPIYCIGFLAKGIFPKSSEYYHFGRLMNQKGEELDQQITHIIVEINKFEKKENDIQSDLDKLIYIMKNLENIKGVDQLPKFLTEDWIEQAMKKLDKSQMTPDQRMHYEMMLAKNATIIEMLKEDEKQRIAKEANMETAKKMKAKGISNIDIQELTNLTIEEIENL
jgi:predicted transposase/invertase (TIGR01784 family)